MNTALDSVDSRHSTDTIAETPAEVAEVVRSAVTEQRNVVIPTEDDREVNAAFEQEFDATHGSVRVSKGDRGGWEIAELSWSNSMAKVGMMEDWEIVAVEKIEVVSNE
ncbi:hypothetical protein NDO75_00570 [Natrinema sp. 1APR25-10V2]|nr:hypothetical protein [Natrinema sp. 1APR25-10V2]